MALPKVYEPKKVENRIYKLWERSGFFNPDRLPKTYHLKPKTYAIVIPPPNITGELHMGHALNTIVQDILIRQKRMQGYQALWLPGTDHAGIAAQNVVERELKKEGLTRFNLGREKFIKRMWQWKEKYGNLILDQLKKIGASCDWSRTRFTMDKNYSLAVKTAFSRYYKKGWIYRGKRVVNWCPRCSTSLSDLELEYREEIGHLWFIKYPLVKISKTSPAQISKKFRRASLKPKTYIVVATTRPETMLGDTAVAVNPKDKRYKHLIDKKVTLPLANREIPIIADRLVDPKFGTGAVKVTPAHDMTDYEIGLRHNLESVQVIDEAGLITKEAPLPYQGMRVWEARQKVVADLENLGLLEKTEDYTHQVPRCSRCGNTCELIPSWQWFLKMEKLAKMAENPVKNGKTKFRPKSFEKAYFDWLKNIKDWCISRQIWWGHRIPVWRCQTGILKSKIKNANSRLRQGYGGQAKINKNYFISLEKPKKCPICGKCRPTQVDDVLDTWFSSALWPFATLGWPRLRQGYGGQAKKKKSDLEKFYPTDVLSTDRGIINLWVARMIFSGMEFMDKVPFSDVYIHATVLTKEGKRMSKSLGTGINLLDLVEKYGADATRFGISYQIMGGQDIRFVEDNIVMGRKFCNKLWNAARFVLLQIPNSPEGKPSASYGAGKLQITNKFKIPNSKLTLADKKVLGVLDETIKSVNKDLENFRFGKAAHTLYNFFWHDFCDIYIEKSKEQLSDKKCHGIKIQTEKILLYVLLNSLKLLHPFVPFITEEIYQKLPIYRKKKFLMVEDWPKS